MASRKEYELLFNLNAQLNGNFASVSKKAQSQLQAIAKEQKELSKSVGDISNYQKQEKSIESTRTKLQNLQGQYDLLQREMQETEGDTSSLERESLKLQQRIQQTTDTLQAQEQRHEAAGQALRDQGIDTANLSEESQRLQNRLQELNDETQDVTEHAQSFGDTAAQAFTGAADFLEQSGIMDGLSKLKDSFLECVNIAAQFQEQMSSVAAISGASSEDMADLTAKAKEMGATTKFTATEAGQAFEYMAKHTWPTVRKLAA